MAAHIRAVPVCAAFAHMNSLTCYKTQASLIWCVMCLAACTDCHFIAVTHVRSFVNTGNSVYTESKVLLKYISLNEIYKVMAKPEFGHMYARVPLWLARMPRSAWRSARVACTPRLRLSQSFLRTLLVHAMRRKHMVPVPGYQATSSR